MLSSPKISQFPGNPGTELNICTKAHSLQNSRKNCPRIDAGAFPTATRVRARSELRPVVAGPDLSPRLGAPPGALHSAARNRHCGRQAAKSPWALDSHLKFAIALVPSGGTLKRSRLRSDLTKLGLSKAHNLCRRGNRHHPPTLTHDRYTLGATRRHGTCDPLADRAAIVLLSVDPVFLCRGVQFVRLHCDVGRAWAFTFLALS